MLNSKEVNLQKFFAKFFHDHFLFPGPTFLRWYGLAAVLTSFYSFVSTILTVGENSVAVGEAAPLVQSPLAAGLLAGLAVLLLALVFYLIIAMYLRLFHTVREDYRQFRAWLPGALKSFADGLRSFWSALTGLAATLRSLPVRLAALSRKLKATSARDRYLAFVSLMNIFLMGACFYLIWPLASHWAGNLPAWLSVHETHPDFSLVLMVATITTMFAMVVVLPLWMALSIAIGRFFFKNAGGNAGGKQ